MINRRDFIKGSVAIGLVMCLPLADALAKNDLEQMLERRGYTVETCKKEFWYSTQFGPEAEVIHYKYTVSHPKFLNDFFVLEDRRNAYLPFRVRCCYCEETAKYSNRVWAMEDSVKSIVDRMDLMVWRANNDPTWRFSPAWKDSQNKYGI